MQHIVRVSITRDSILVREFAVRVPDLSGNIVFHPENWAMDRIKCLDQRAREEGDEPIIPDGCEVWAEPMEFENDVEELYHGRGTIKCNTSSRRKMISSLLDIVRP